MLVVTCDGPQLREARLERERAVNTPVLGAGHERDVAPAKLLLRQNRGEQLGEPDGQSLVVQHAFGREPAVHVLGVPHRPLALQLPEPALITPGTCLDQLVKTLHLFDVLAGRVPGPVPDDGREVRLATLCGRGLQS